MKLVVGGCCWLVLVGVGWCWLVLVVDIGWLLLVDIGLVGLACELTRLGISMSS